MNLSALAVAASSVTPRALVVNSDATIAKYAEVQISFVEAFTGLTHVVDLRAAGEAQLRRVFAAENFTVVHCIGAAAYQAIAQVARDKPVILSGAINWERLNASRQTRVIAYELPAVTQLTLFRNFFPKLAHIGVAYNRDINRQWFDQAAAAGREVGIEVIGRPVSRAPQVPAALAELTTRVDALWLVPDPVVLEDATAVRGYFDRADAARKPVFTYSTAFADFGATLILAPDTITIGRQAAGLAQDLAAAPKLSTPAGSEVTLSLKRVQQFGLELNRDALDSVNQLIR